MEKKKINKKTILIIIGLFLIGLLTVVGTYAYFAWNSTDVNKNASISVTSVNGLGQCDKLTDNQKLLWPVSSRDNGRIVTVNTKQTLSEYAYITWTLTIDSINTQETETAGLKHQTFKYELVNTTTGVSYGSGNFEGKTVGDTITFSNNTENLAYNTNYTFTLYLWIDGTIGTNPLDMASQTYEFSLVCDITGEGTNKVQPIDINALHITTEDDYEYTLFDKEDTEYDVDYVLLTKYIGTYPNIQVPNTMTVSGKEYKTVLHCRGGGSGEQNTISLFKNNSIIETVTLPDQYLVSAQADTSSLYLSTTEIGGLFCGCTSLVNVLNIPDGITDMYCTFAGCTSLVNTPMLPNSVTNMDWAFVGCTSLLNISNIPSSVVRMVKTFGNCTSLVTVPAIPNSVMYMNTTFYNCTSLSNIASVGNSVSDLTGTFSGCTNLTGTIRINSSNASFGSYLGPFSLTTKPITIEVPAGSTTYDNFNGRVPNNVTVTTFTPE